MTTDYFNFQNHKILRDKSVCRLQNCQMIMDHFDILYYTMSSHLFAGSINAGVSSYRWSGAKRINPFAGWYKLLYDILISKHAFLQCMLVRAGARFSTTFEKLWGNVKLMDKCFASVWCDKETNINSLKTITIRINRFEVIDF